MILERLRLLLLATFDLLGVPDHRPPRLTFFHCPNKPYVDEVGVIRWGSKFADSGRLVVGQEDKMVLYDGVVPATGMITIMPPTASALKIALTLYPHRASKDDVEYATYEWFRRVRARRPKFCYVLVWYFGRVGKPIFIRWRCPKAQKVVISIDDGYETITYDNEKVDKRSGMFLYYPERSGKTIIRVKASTGHAEETECRVVWVRPSPPKIILKETILFGPPGSRATISFATTNASNVWMEIPSRDESHPLKSTGEIFVTIGDQPETVLLMASQPDVIRTKKLTLMPFYSLEPSYT